MINKEQIERYIEYKGDLDKWVRSQKGSMDDTLSGADWNLIEKAVNRLRLERSMSASHDYKAETERVLNKTFENAEVIQLARKLVDSAK